MLKSQHTVPSALPTKPSSVLVEDHPFEWGTNVDPDVVTADRILTRGSDVQKGCHYLNPGFTVTSAEPTVEFFRAVQDAQTGWMSRCRESAGDQPELIEHRKRHMIDLGLFFGGTLFIRGQMLPRKVWAEMASDRVPSPFNAGLKATWRIPDLETLAVSDDPESLRVVVRHELRQHLATDPKASVFVTPGFTVAKADDCLGFLHTVRCRQKLWQFWLRNALGTVRCKELKAAADLPTRMTVYLGTLVLDGQIYVPGLWPDNKVTEKRLLNSPFKSPTLPPDYLGLETRR